MKNQQESKKKQINLSRLKCNHAFKAILDTTFNAIDPEIDGRAARCNKSKSEEIEVDRGISVTT